MQALTAVMHVVFAWKLSQENTADVIAMIRKTKCGVSPYRFFGDKGIEIHLNTGDIIYARIGQWVVGFSDGNVGVFDHQTYMEKYETTFEGSKREGVEQLLRGCRELASELSGVHSPDSPPISREDLERKAALLSERFKSLDEALKYDSPLPQDWGISQLHRQIYKE